MKQIEQPEISTFLCWVLPGLLHGNLHPKRLLQHHFMLNEASHYFKYLISTSFFKSKGDSEKA